MLFVVLLAMVAAFLAMRLYMVLGKRTGHEQEAPLRAVEERAIAHAPRMVDAGSDVREVPSIGGKATVGLRSIASAEPGFDAIEFVEGAKGAYRMILEAFWKGDEDTLKWLTDADTAEAFAEAIAARTSAGHVLDNRLVRIDQAAIVAATVERGTARVTIRFDADIAAATRDADGVLVSGSLTDASETHDIWTFARTLGDSDPNWKLVETDAA